MSTREPVRIFYSYSHHDETSLNKLRLHLTQLKREGLIKEWYDREISPGSSFAQEIDENLSKAQVILLLISPYFLASDYCYDVEMAKALQRARREGVRVIPIILRNVEGWQQSPFGHLQVLPKDGKPVMSWRDKDAAWSDVAQGIRKAIVEITSQPDIFAQERINTLHQLSEQADEYLGEGLYNYAIPLLLQMAQGYEDDLSASLAWLDLGKAYNETRQREKAVAAFDRA